MDATSIPNCYNTVVTYDWEFFRMRKKKSGTPRGRHAIGLNAPDAKEYSSVPQDVDEDIWEDVELLEDDAALDEGSYDEPVLAVHIPEISPAEYKVKAKSKNAKPRGKAAKLVLEVDDDAEVEAVAEVDDVFEEDAVFESDNDVEIEVPVDDVDDAAVEVEGAAEADDVFEEEAVFESDDDSETDFEANAADDDVDSQYDSATEEYYDDVVEGSEEDAEYDDAVEGDFPAENDDADVAYTETASPAAFTPYEALASKKKKNFRKTLKVAAIFFGSVIALTTLTYGAGLIYFSKHFYPNTTIGAYDVSLKTQQDAKPIIAQGVSEYQLNARGQGLSFDFSAQDLELSWDEEAIVANAFSDIKAWMWPAEVLKEHDASDKLRAGYNKADLDANIRAQLAEFNKNTTPPVNATLAYSAGEKVFEIVPESFGTAVDPNAVVKALDQAIVTQQESLDFTQQELVHALIGAENELLLKARTSANRMLETNPRFTMAGFEVAELTPDIMAKWIKLTDNVEIRLDDEALNAWIDMVAEGCNTVGSERTYTRPDGKEITVEGGTYGWEVDVDALRELIKKTITAGGKTTLDLPVIQEGTGFTGVGKRDWGKRYCDIDLSEQHARFYNEEGECIWESDLISGRPDGIHDTPEGVWVLNEKASPSLLVGEPLPGQKEPEYRTWVTYWMPFVWGAIGMHDATWQPSFGGSMYANGYGSHGCVNLPYYAAEELYDLIEEGDPVISHW